MSEHRGLKAFLGSAAVLTGTSLSALADEALPKLPAPFAGKIDPDRNKSIANWPQTPKAPKGAPNIIVILLDDVGFGAASTFGGPAATPELDKLAATGIRYNQFNTVAICSPTRAALLTGRNHHQVGFGNLADIATKGCSLKFGPSRVLIDGEVFTAKASLLIGCRAHDYLYQVFGLELFEDVHPRAGQEWRYHLEGRVLGRSADERDSAVLDVGEKRVLLRLVEAVYLVDEEDCTGIVELAPVACLGDYLAKLGHSRGHRAELDELALRGSRDYARQRRLAGAGRAPE